MVEMVVMVMMMMVVVMMMTMTISTVHVCYPIYPCCQTWKRSYPKLQHTGLKAEFLISSDISYSWVTFGIA